jgi:hypothetical protein
MTVMSRFSLARARRRWKASMHRPVSYPIAIRLTLQLLLLLGCAWAHAAEYRIGRPDDSPNATMLEIERRVVDAYRRIGVSASVLSLPALRSAAYAKQDLVDAELLRVDVPERNNEFIRIDIPLVVFDVVAVGHSNIKHLDQPSSLGGLRVGVLRGVWALLHTASSAATLEQAPDYKSLNLMLEEGRVDVALMLTSNFPQFMASHADDWASHQIEILNPHISRYPAYHFVSPRHADLVPKLTKSLRQENLPVVPSQMSTPAQ